MKPKNSLRAFLALAGSSLLAVFAASAQTGTWITDGDAAWNNTANWQDGTIATGSGNTANLTAELTANRIITLGENRTIGNITFTDGTTSSNNLAITGNTLTLAGTTPTISVTQSGRILTISSVVAGTSGFTKTGVGRVDLTAANSFSGNVTISEGILRAGNGTTTANSLNARPVSIASGAELQINSPTVSGNAISIGTLSGSGVVTVLSNMRMNVVSNQTSSGNLAFSLLYGSTLGVSHGNDGVTAVHLGELSGNGIIQRSGATTTGAATITIGAKNTNSTFGGVISGTTGNFSIDKVGTGTLTLTGANNYTGTTTISNGTLQIGNGRTIGAIAATSAVTNNGTLIFDRSDAVTHSGAIDGSGGLVQAGGNTLNLTAANGYTGATTIRQGTLNLGGGTATGSLASTSLVIGGNGTFNFSRTGTNSQSFSGGTTLNAGASTFTTTATNTLNLGAITRNARGTLNITSGSKVTTTTVNHASGILGGWATLNGADWAVGNGGSSDITGLASYTDLPTSTGDAATNYRMTAATTLGGNVSAHTLKLEAPGGNLALGTNRLTLEGGGLLSTGNTGRNITGTSGATRLTAGAGSNYNLFVHQYNTGGLIIDAVVGDNGGNAVTLIKTGTQNLTLNGANTHTGGFHLNAGTVSIANNSSAFGAGALSISGGTTISMTSGANVTLSQASNWNGNFSLSRGTTGAATITFNGDVTLGANTTLTHADNTVTTIVNGNIGETGGSRGLTIAANTGSVTLAGDNTMTGGVTLTAGTLNLNGDNTSMTGGVTLAGGTLNINSATALGTGTLAITATSTIANTSGSAITLSTNNAQIWTGSFTFTGSNDLNLGTGYVSANNGLTYTVSGTGRLTVGGEIGVSGTNGFSKGGTGTLALTNENSNHGAWIGITGGVLEVTKLANGGQASSIGASAAGGSNLIINNGTLRYVGSGDSTDRQFRTTANAAGVAMTLDASGTGAINWTGSSGPSHQNSNQTRTLNLIGSNTDNNTFAANLTDNGSGALTLNKNGTGTWLLTGTTSNYTGGTNVNQGVLNTASAAALAGYTTAGKVVINGGALGVRVGGSGWTTAQVDTMLTNATKTSGALGVDTTNGDLTQWTAFTTTNFGSSLGLTKLGSNTLTLDQANTYTGATTVSAGTLEVASTGSINSTSGITIASGAHFKYNSSTALTQPITNNGGTISGTGKVGVSVALASTSSILAPGNSPGVQEYTVGQSWASFTYQWEVEDFAGTVAGTDFDQIQITGGALALTGGAAGSYVLDVASWLGLSSGDVTNFSETTTSWDILTASGGITGFNKDYWTIDTSGFTTDLSSPEFGGTWSLSLNDTLGTDSLVLTYAPIPEPRAALLGGIGILLLLRRRRS